MPEPISLQPGQKQLFLDDFVVQEIQHLDRTMHRPEKSDPLLKADRPSDGSHIAIASAPMWIPDEGIYKFPYEVRRDDSNGKEMALAVSTDGLHWEKPDLGLVSFEGSTKNNLFPTPDNRRLWHIVYDPDDPDDARRYKGFVTVPGGRHPVVSPDCLHWTKLDIDPQTLPSGDAGTLTYDRDNKQFLGLLKFKSQYGRAYNLTTSTDFANWTEPRFLFGTDEEDQTQAIDVIRRRLANPNFAKPLMVAPDPSIGWREPDPSPWRGDPTWRAECYNMGVFPYEGLHIATLMIYYPTGPRLPEGTNCDGFHHIQLAMTRDLKTWTRLGNREPFIGPSPLSKGLVGNYDRLQLQVTNQPLDRGDELWFYYEGMKSRVPQHDRWTDGSPRDPSTLTPEERADWLEDTLSGVYVAVLRKDGFVSLDAEPQGGQILTHPLKWAGDHLFLNLDAPAGHARLELLDARGVPIPGLSGEDAPIVHGDGICLHVPWPRNLSALSGQTVQLRIHLQNARLYAFWTA
ncbi:MAG: hypothetical protein O7G87_16840 [bacterium]|nr:hypothetical protein [bacterium]